MNWEFGGKNSKLLVLFFGFSKRAKFFMTKTQIGLGTVNQRLKICYHVRKDTNGTFKI